MRLKAIIGSEDYTQDIAYDDGEYGYAIQYIARTSGEAFTSISAIEYDNKVGYKAEVSLTFDPMEASKATKLLQLLLTQKYVPLTYDDLAFGTRTIEAILGDVSTQITLISDDGVEYWKGISITLIER